MKKYFLYADIYRAKITDSQIREYFRMAMEDVGIEHMYLDKHQGRNDSIENPTSIVIKEQIFGAEKGRGYLYKFHTENELTNSQLSLIKNSLIMNIMGVVDIKSDDALSEFSYIVKSHKRIIKEHKNIVRRLDELHPKLKYINVEKCKIKDITKQMGNYYYSHYQIECYIKYRKSQLKLQELLCS